MDTYSGWSNPDDASAGNAGIYRTGVSYYRSQVPIRWVKDGLSYTYLVGEKFLYSDQYGSGLDGADNEFLFTGWDNDLYRSGGINSQQWAACNTTPTPADHAPLHDTIRIAGDDNTVANEGNLWACPPSGLEYGLLRRFGAHGPLRNRSAAAPPIAQPSGRRIGHPAVIHTGHSVCLTIPSRSTTILAVKMAPVAIFICRGL